MMLPFENTDISLHFAQMFLYQDRRLVSLFQSSTVNGKETNCLNETIPVNLLFCAYAELFHGVDFVLYLL